MLMDLPTVEFGASVASYRCDLHARPCRAGKQFQPEHL